MHGNQFILLDLIGTNISKIVEIFIRRNIPVEGIFAIINR